MKKRNLTGTNGRKIWAQLFFLFCLSGSYIFWGQPSYKFLMDARKAPFITFEPVFYGCRFYSNVLPGRLLHKGSRGTLIIGWKAADISIFLTISGSDNRNCHEAG